MDGFDGSEIVYDEKAEKSYHARIWWALFIAATLIFLRGVTFHIDEVKLVKTGNMIVANYNDTTAQAFYIEDNGTYHQYDVSGYSAAHEENQIKLYYEDEIAYALPARETGFWIKTYLFFGGAMLFTGYKLWKVYKG